MVGLSRKLTRRWQVIRMYCLGFRKFFLFHNDPGIVPGLYTVNFAGHRTIWGRFNGECVDLNFENVLCHIVPLSGQEST